MSRCLLFLLLLLCGASFAQSIPSDVEARTLVVKNAGGKRVALVMGNGNYQHPDILPRLANPVHDAEDMAAALRKFGFDVIEKNDMSLEGMSEAIAEFGRRSVSSDAALFYFAGHGLQVKGQNYLVPVNARIESEAQVPFQSINVNQLLEEMDNARSRVNIVMLDACRNNPISGKFRSGATRGLAPPGSSPKGTVIVYATDPGNAALDGEGRNGLFTAGLLTAFKEGDLSLHGVLVRASREVERRSEGRQTPYVNGPATLQEEFSFARDGHVPVQVHVETADGESKKPVMVAIPGRGYEMGKYLVTRGEFARFVSETGYDAGTTCYVKRVEKWENLSGNNWRNPGFVQDDSHPVTCVNWNDAQAYISWLSNNTGRQYRLPTESEWAYACDGGRQAEYCGGNEADALAWFKGNSGGQTHPVGRKQANGYGLYDMSGNVMEWMADKYDNEHDWRVLRGGAWNYAADVMYAAFRSANEAVDRVDHYGFRLARTLPAEESRMSFAEPSMVRIPERNYEMGKYEVTQKEWREVMGGNPSYFSGCGEDCPVEQVSWNDVQEFIRKLNAKTGRQYRLPTEIEWKVACFGGTQAEYCGGNDLDGMAWYEGNSGGQPHPVGQKQPNGYGLYDMTGNVREWGQDCFKNVCSERVLRGGGWSESAKHARASFHYRFNQGERHKNLGFRLARTLP